MSRKLTTEEFKKEIFELVGDSYTLLGSYVNNRTHLQIRHNSCEDGGFHVYDVTPTAFKGSKSKIGTRCPKCYGNIKLTTEGFKKEVFDLVKNEYTVLGKYTNTHTPIEIRHNYCKDGNFHEYEVMPSNFKRDNRCPKCFGTVKLTTEKFKKEVYKLVKNEYSVLGEYTNYDTHIKMRHNHCEDGEVYEYDVTPSNFKNGRRCPKCFGNNKPTTEEFKKEVCKLTKDEYSVLGEYIDSKTYIKMRHNKCKDGGFYEYDVVPSSFKNMGTRCPKCFGNIKSSTEEFKKQVSELVGDEYSVISEYKGNDTHIKMRHNHCEDGRSYEYSVTPSKFKLKKRCPKCYGNPLKTTEKFKKEVFELVKNEYVVIGSYTNARTPIKMRHNKCTDGGSHEYEVTPSDFKSSGQRCPKCNESKGESKISKWLTENQYHFERQYRINECRNKRALPFDFSVFVENKIILIEYQGIQHYEEFEHFGGEKKLAETQKNDKIKSDFCKSNNIPLIHIEYWNFDKIEPILTIEIKKYHKSKQTRRDA